MCDRDNISNCFQWGVAETVHIVFTHTLLAAIDNVFIDDRQEYFLLNGGVVKYSRIKVKTTV